MALSREVGWMILRTVAIIVFFDCFWMVRRTGFLPYIPFLVCCVIRLDAAASRTLFPVQAEV